MRKLEVFCLEFANTQDALVDPIIESGSVIAENQAADGKRSMLVFLPDGSEEQLVSAGFKGLVRRAENHEIELAI
jgi:hypothetical protein